MEVGVVGKPNVGKSTFFKALTLSEVEVAAFPFTTIKANVGVGHVRAECPCKSLEVECSPKNSFCVDGTRFIPVKMLDVAGLVPGAAQGRGLGNQFLDDLRQADVLIHVIDVSGTTDENGESAKGHDPRKDVGFLEDEIDLWFADIIQRNWGKVSGRIQHSNEKPQELLAEQLSGLGIREDHVIHAFKETGLSDKKNWDRGDVEEFARILRAASKPIVIAANKIDLDEQNLEAMKDEMELTGVCAEAELALREACEKDLIDYTPGGKEFNVTGDLGEKQLKALEYIREKILAKHGSTGVQEVLEKAVFDKLGYISVYPVENENKYTDKKGNILPDAHLLPAGSTVLELAYKIHSDIGDNFVGAIDCKTGMKVARDHVLADGDVVKIHSRS